MDENTHDLINDNPYAGKVIEFRRDKRISEDSAIGNGTYGYMQERKRTRILPVANNGGDAA